MLCKVPRSYLCSDLKGLAVQLGQFVLYRLGRLVESSTSLECALIMVEWPAPSSVYGMPASGLQGDSAMFHLQSVLSAGMYSQRRGREGQGRGGGKGSRGGEEKEDQTLGEAGDLCDCQG